jgi:PRTRC genetic system protein C
METNTNAPLDSVPLKRIFKYEKNGKTIELTDPSPNMSPQEVVKFYCGQYPELTNASVEQPEYEGSNIIFNISEQTGTLG